MRLKTTVSDDPPICDRCADFQDKCPAWSAEQMPRKASDTPSHRNLTGMKTVVHLRPGRRDPRVGQIRQAPRATKPGAHYCTACLVGPGLNLARLRKHFSQSLRCHVSPVSTELVAQFGPFAGQYCHCEQSSVHCTRFADRERADRNSARHLNG